MPKRYIMIMYSRSHIPSSSLSRSQFVDLTPVITDDTRVTEAIWGPEHLDHATNNTQRPWHKSDRNQATRNTLR
jgi:hypothetical protein